MVIREGCPQMQTQPLIMAALALFAQSETLFEQLSPLNRLRVLMGLVLVLVLGVVIFMVIRAGAHMVRGFSAAARRLPKTSLPDPDDWARRPLDSSAENDG